MTLHDFYDCISSLHIDELSTDVNDSVIIVVIIVLI